MSTPRSQRPEPLDSSTLHPSTPSRNDGPVASILSGGPPPTYASFSPATLSTTTPSATSAAKRRSTILVHQKSPLLLATPPQVTRALAYSHPFLLPLNKLVGLLTWTTGDPWESFLMVAAFWAAVLYGDIVVRVAGPLVLVLVLIAGMYGRRFSPLSSSGWSEPGLGTKDGTAAVGDAKGPKVARRSKNLSVDGLADKNGKMGNGSAAAGKGHTRNRSSTSEATNTRHQKTLDEIVESLREFTARCNILLEPLLELTDFLSTQSTPTSATTRPALTTLFIRILLCIPFWFLLTLPPLRIITTRRVILILGTILLTWHARVIRVTRAILWRSATIRRMLALVTGLSFEDLSKTPSASPTAATDSAASSAATTTKTPSTPSAKTPRESELTKALRRARGSRSTGVRFTFIIYENQRRWVAWGWAPSQLMYDRPAWTDEHNNAVPPRDHFELPEVADGSNMRWRWVEGSRWRVDGVADEGAGSDFDYDGPAGRNGWVYYDTKWQHGRRGQDGWNRWTRRRKWYRDAELVEIQEEDTPTSPSVVTKQPEKTPTPSIPAVDLSPSSPDVPRSSSSSSPTSSPPERSTPIPTGSDKTSITNLANNTISQDRAEEAPDTASLLSTSSRSARFMPPSLRRRITDSSSTHRSSASVGSISGVTAGGRSSRSRSRRTSRSSIVGGGGDVPGAGVGNGGEEDDEVAAALLGTQARIAVQEASAEVGSWGVGDEVRMGLE
ncbi:hypothetical protein VTI74DRAFT_10599 [Chaetomium olivicolor]